MTVEESERELRNTLAHLYDPRFQPSATICEMTGYSPGAGSLAVQSAIIRAIESMKLPPGGADDSPGHRIHELLHNRFVRRLTLEETAERMDVSVSTVSRFQRVAIHAFARLLRDKRQRGEQADEVSASDVLASETQASDWRAQVRRELASLRASAPGAVSDVEEVISGVLEVMNSGVLDADTSVELKYVQPGMVAAVHPSVLRQVLIAAVGRVVPYSSNGQIDIYASFEDANVKITIMTLASGGNLPGEMVLGGAIAAFEELPVHVSVENDNLFLWIEVPSVGKVRVLVVDDNPDMVRFYRSSTMGTRYEIVQLAEGGDLFRVIEDSSIDVIVLDVMLPDVDGWQLLMRLHQDAAARQIPVVICTVVREESLALSLGAAHYLAKPVGRREFLQALSRVLPHA